MVLSENELKHLGLHYLDNDDANVRARALIDVLRPRFHPNDFINAVADEVGRLRATTEAVEVIIGESLGMSLSAYTHRRDVYTTLMLYTCGMAVPTPDNVRGWFEALRPDRQAAVDSGDLSKVIRREWTVRRRPLCALSDEEFAAVLRGEPWPCEEHSK